MRQFVAILTGKGEGCDYTIGCNVRVVELQAETFMQAFEKLAGDRWSDYVSGDADPKNLTDGERSYAKVELIEVARRDDGETFKGWVEQLTKKAAQDEESARRAADEAEFERLRKRLGK